MRQSVRDGFWNATAEKEGYTTFPYADRLNLVTTGVGDLIDNGPRNSYVTDEYAIAPAYSLPWKRDGRMATRDEIRNAWLRVKLKDKESPGFNRQGGFAYQGLTDIYLTKDDVWNLYNSTLDNFEYQLRVRFPDWDTWPADAQFAVLSMSWAMGPGFAYPKFSAAVNQNPPDFRTAANESYGNGMGGTVENRSGRNKENFDLLNHAAQTVESGGNYETLNFPEPPQQAGESKGC